MSLLSHPPRLYKSALLFKEGPAPSGWWIWTEFELVRTGSTGRFLGARKTKSRSNFLAKQLSLNFSRKNLFQAGSLHFTCRGIPLLKYTAIVYTGKWVCFLFQYLAVFISKTAISYE
jgi:hypothetical protein